MNEASITLALGLVSQGMRLWADRADSIAKGEATDADLDTWSDELGTDIDELRALAAKQRAEAAAAVKVES